MPGLLLQAQEAFEEAQAAQLVAQPSIQPAENGMASL